MSDTPLQIQVFTLGQWQTNCFVLSVGKSCWIVDAGFDPEPMLDAVERLARDRSLLVQLSYERYMRCGFGIGGSCAQGDWLPCADGPVKTI